MNNSLILTLITLSLLLAGCAESSLVVAKPGASLPGDEVSVYYIDRPRCNFETIAHIRVTGGYFSLESMVSKMRRQAAEAGASGFAEDRPPQQQADAPLASPPHPAPQLVELREAEAIGVFDCFATTQYIKARKPSSFEE